MSDIVERLSSDLRQLLKMKEHAALCGPETDVRVKNPEFLVKDLVDAIAEIESLEKERDYAVRWANKAVEDVKASYEAELANARNAALEQAAEILDDAGETLVDEWTSDLGGTDQTRAAGISSHRVADAAAAIRALKAEGESRT